MVEAIMVNLFLRDAGVANVAAFVLGGALFVIGWSPISSISLSLLAFSAFLLVFGSALGFFLSSVSFDWLTSLLGRSEKKEEQSEVEKRRADTKSKAEARKEQVDTGKRLIFIGLLLLAESLMISLAYVIA